MSGLTSANSPQSTPMSPASRFCNGRNVLLPDAEGPLVFITTGRSCGRSTRKPSRATAFAIIGSRRRPIISLPRSLQAMSVASAAIISRPPQIAAVANEERRDDLGERRPRGAASAVARPGGRLPFRDQAPFAVGVGR